MDPYISVIDIVTLIIALLSATVVIACAFYCYVKDKAYTAEHVQVIGALQAVNAALVQLATRTEECEDAYIGTLRNLYRVDKTVGAMTGDVMGVSPDGSMGQFGTEGDDDLGEDDDE